MYKNNKYKYSEGPILAKLTWFKNEEEQGVSSTHNARFSTHDHYIGTRTCTNIFFTFGKWYI